MLDGGARAVTIPDASPQWANSSPLQHISLIENFYLGKNPAPVGSIFLCNIKNMIKKTSSQEDISKQESLVALPPKEVKQLQGNISTLVTSANNLTIKTADDLTLSADLLKGIREARDVVRDRKDKITRPLMASLASARELFKPFESAFDDAEKIVKGKVLAFQKSEEERIEKEKDRIAKRVDAGQMKGETAIKKLENLGEIVTSASGITGTIQTRNITKVRIFDASLIPREYLVPDMNLITKAILQEGIDVPGVEKYQEKTIVSR